MKRFSLTKPLLSKVIAYLCVFSLIIGMVPATYAAEETGDAQESELLVHLRGEIATYIETYELSHEMPDSALAEVFFALDSEASYAAWTTANTLKEEANGLSVEEGEILLSEVNTMLGLRFYNIMERIICPAVIDTTKTDLVPVDGIGVTVVASSDNTLSKGDNSATINETTGAITITTQAPVESCKSKPVTNTITIMNTTSYSATVSFSWAVTPNTDNTTLVVNDITETGTEGSFSGILAAGASVTIKFTNDGTNRRYLALSNFSYVKDENTKQVTVTFPEGADVTANGTAISSGDVLSVASEGLALSANPTGFIAWVNSSNVIVSLLPEFTYAPEAEVSSLRSLYDTVGCYRVGNKIFDDLDLAFAEAVSGSNKTVALLNDVTFAAGTYTIPTGVTFLIPYDVDNTARSAPDASGDKIIYQGSIAGVVAYEDMGISNALFRTLTLESGANIVVKGELQVGGRTHPMGSGTLGAYAQITMESGSKVTVEEGGTLSAWGFIKGDGTVEVKSGGTVYENLTATDYPGSADNLNTLNDKGAFPLTEYTANNVEVLMTVNSGATLKGFMAIYGGTIKYNGFTKTVIGSTTDDMLQLTSGTITKSYVSSRQKFVLNGQGAINPLKIEAAISIPIIGDIGIKINSETTGLPIPATWDLSFESGKVTVNNTLLLLAGSTMTINTDAEVEIPAGTSIHILDADQDPSAVEADANIVVNGTVTVNGSVDVTEGGASITSTGGGKIVYNADCAAGSVIVKKSATDVETLNTVPAKLTNADGTLVDTAGTTAVTTYTYSEGFWCTGHDYRETETKDPTCLANGEKTSVCSVCGKVIKETIAASGHDFGAVVEENAATCLAAGNEAYKQCQCTVCKLYFAADAATDAADGKADNTSFVIPKLEHSYTGTIKSDGNGKDATHSRLCVNGCNQYGSAVSHTWNEGKVTTEPSCTETGIKTYTCTVDGCGATYTEELDMLDTVAMIGDTPYASLAAAIDALGSNGGEIQLVADCTLDTAVNATPVEPIIVFRNGYTAEGLDIADTDYGVAETLDAYVLGPVEGFLFEKANVHMGNSLEMMFAFNASLIDQTDIEGYKVKIQKLCTHSGTSTTVEQPVSEMDTLGSYRVVSYDGLVAKEMTDIVILTIYDKDNNRVGNPWVDSMRGYAMRILNRDTSSDTQKALIVAFLNYGDAAQRHFKHGETDPANLYLTAEQKVLGTMPEITIDFEPGKLKTSTLSLESSINFKIAIDGLSGEEKTATVAFTDHYGTPVSYTAQIETATVGEETEVETIYYVVVDRIVVADAWQAVTVTVETDGEDIVCCDSIAAFLNRYSADPTYEYTDIEIAVMRFAEAAYDFLHPDEQ